MPFDPVCCQIVESYSFFPTRPPLFPRPDRVALLPAGLSCQRRPDYRWHWVPWSMTRDTFGYERNAVNNSRLTRPTLMIMFLLRVSVVLLVEVNYWDRTDPDKSRTLCYTTTLSSVGPPLATQSVRETAPLEFADPTLLI